MSDTTAEGGWRPLCTNCAFPASHVYTTYTSRSNIRLGVCDNCGGFIDPLIEAPPLLLFLDLVLLKPRVFLHLLFNRGSPPRRAGEPAKVAAKSSPSSPSPPTVETPETPEAAQQGAEGALRARVAGEEGAAEAGAGERRADTGRGEDQAATPQQPESEARTTNHWIARTVLRDETVHCHLTRLFAATLLAEVCVRLTTSSSVSSALILVTGVRVALEFGAQLFTSTLLALLLLWGRGWWRPRRCGLYEPDVSFSRGPSGDRDEKSSAEADKDGRRPGFLPALIPLVLLYTTLLPLLLQLALSVWSSASPTLLQPAASPAGLTASLAELAPGLVRLIPPTAAQQLDTVWASSNKLSLGTRLLGGMSAGFGLRVLLPTPPLLTTAVVLAGWGAAVGVGSVLDP